MSILDASAIVALLKKEPGHEAVADAVASGAVICDANLAEVATVLVRNGLSSDEISAVLAELPVAVIEVTRDLAMQAGLLSIW